MKQESKPDGHYGSKASGTEETAGRCCTFKTQKHEIHKASAKILCEYGEITRKE